MDEFVNDRGVLILGRLIDLLQDRLARASRHTTDERNTFHDGFANGISEALSLVSRSIRHDVPDFDDRVEAVSKPEVPTQ